MLAQDLLDADAALTPTLILLNQANRTNDFHIQCERVVHDLLDRLAALVMGSGQVRVHDLVNQEFFFLHGLGLGLGLFFSSLLLLFAFLCLLLFLLGVTLNLLLKRHLNLYFIVFFEVLGHGNLDDTWVILQIKQELIKVHINGFGSRIEKTKFFLHFTNACHGRFEHPLDKQALLWVHDLVVASLKLAENVNVLDVEARQVLENFIFRPRLYILNHKKKARLSNYEK